MSIDTEEVAYHRTVKMVDRSDGLRSARTLKVRVDVEEPLYELDFSDDLGECQMIADVDTPAITEGTGGGLSFEVGKSGPCARLRIAATVADDYEVLVRVLYGADWRAGIVTVKAT